MFGNPDGLIMHAEYSTEAWPPFPCGMYVVTKEVDDIYAKGLANGGKGNQEPGEREYGRSSGGFVDEWGNQWWLNWPDYETK